MTARTYILTVDRNRPDKRRQLTSALDVAIIMDGARIHAGEYEVTVRRIGPEGTYVDPDDTSTADREVM